MRASYCCFYNCCFAKTLCHASTCTTVLLLHYRLLSSTQHATHRTRHATYSTQHAANNTQHTAHITQHATYSTWRQFQAMRAVWIRTVGLIIELFVKLPIQSIVNKYNIESFLFLPCSSCPVQDTFESAFRNVEVGKRSQLKFLFCLQLMRKYPKS